MLIGYCRVSTTDQCLDRQIDALKGYGVERIYSEKMTGTKRNRPELNRMVDTMRSGDTIVVESLSRLGRSTKDLLELVNLFNANGVNLVSLKEAIDISTPTGKLLLTVLSAISQFERDIIVQRTNEGLKSARARGRKGGRPKADKGKLDKAIKLYQAQTHSVKEITEITGISSATLYRAIRQQSG